jgi:hypothetical protein
MKYDLQNIDKLSVEKTLAHENEKQKVCLFNTRTYEYYYQYQLFYPAEGRPVPLGFIVFAPQTMHLPRLPSERKNLNKTLSYLISCLINDL